MNWFKIEDYKYQHLLLVIAFIILVIPPVLTLPAFTRYYYFLHTGEIGDTIGGITAPFINGLAVILIFLAFKAQRRANDILVNSNDLLFDSNEILRKQEDERAVMDQILSIKGDQFDIETVISSIENRLGELSGSLQPSMLNRLTKIRYFMHEFRAACELISAYNGDKMFLYRKLYNLYQIRYKDLFAHLLDSLVGQRIHKDYQQRIQDIREEYAYVDNVLSDPNKYMQL